MPSEQRLIAEKGRGGFQNGKENKGMLLHSEQQPVTLSPSWEAQKLTNDELNFKGLPSTDDDDMLLKPPRDKWKIVFLIFLLHGLGILMPWNMFITAKDYFVNYKLNNTDTSSDNPSSYGANFLQYIGLASQIPNITFNWLNVFINLGGDLTKRIVYSILVEICIFILTVILAMIDSSAWPGVFFWITMISVVLLNMANGVYQNTIYGMAATLPTKYTGAVVLGSNISGVFATVISIFSTYIFPSQRTSAIYYFITAMMVLLLCFDTYFALPLNKFYRYHELQKQKNAQKEIESTLESTTATIPYWQIFKKTFPQLYNVFFTLFVTLAVFPAIHSDIKPINSDFIITPRYFTVITCYLTFNLFAMLGSLATSWIQWPGPKYLSVPVTIRAVFIPLFLFCNYLPKDIIRTLPVYIDNDWCYLAIAIVMSFTSGYFNSLGMMYVPQAVEPKHQVTAGMFAAAMLITGIFSGISFSLLFPLLVT